MRARIVFLGAFLFACSSRSEPETPSPSLLASSASSPPPALDAAHEAYLRSDWLTMTDRLRDVLVDRSSTDSVRENAFDLLDKAYEATNGKLPSRFEKPPGLHVIKLGSNRGQHAWATYRTSFLYLQVDPGLGKHVTDLVVRSLPDTPILDRAAGIGEVRVTPLPKDGVEEVVIEAKKQTSAISDGVASIHIGFDDGRVIDTWVIVRGLSSSASPEIATPSQAEAIADESPTIEWTPFRSPEYAPFERRTLSLWVAEDKTDKDVFDHWTGEPGELRRMKIDKKLAPNTYWLALTAGEERMFGPIRLSRQSQRGVPFSVVK